MPVAAEGLHREQAADARKPSIRPAAFFPLRASIIAKNCFRPPRPNGIPMVAAAVFREICGIEGVEGNVHASRAWKGNDQQRCIRTRASRFSFPAQSKQRRFRHSLFALRQIGGLSKEALANSERRRANSVLLTTNTDGASAICGSPSPIAATTGASIAARAATARSFRRCRSPTTCAWRASSSAWASPRSV